MREFTMSHFRMMLLPFSAALLLALTACGKSPDAEAEAAAPAGESAEAAGESNHAEKDGHADEEGEAALNLDAAEIEAAGLRVEVLQPSTLSERLHAPGEVIHNAYGTTLITPRVESLVVERHARIGDEVEAGDPLVTLSSVEVAEAQAALRIAAQEWERVSELGREAVAGRRITEAKVALDRARAIARAYGLPGTVAGSSNGQFTLTAPHAGRITADDFVVGERIEPGRPLFRLVDESVVWVDAKLPPNVVSRIEPGSTAMIVEGGERIAGKVMRSAHRTSEATRNAEVRIEVPNKEDRLHAGDFVDVYFKAPPGSASDQGAKGQLSVPSEAIVQLDGEKVVFRRNKQGAFESVPVRTGEVVDDRTIVSAGLAPGDKVVVEGAFALKSQILKSQMGEGHAH